MEIDGAIFLRLLVPVEREARADFSYFPIPHHTREKGLIALSPGGTFGFRIRHFPRLPQALHASVAVLSFLLIGREENGGLVVIAEGAKHHQSSG